MLASSRTIVSPPPPPRNILSAVAALPGAGMSNRFLFVAESRTHVKNRRGGTACRCIAKRGPENAAGSNVHRTARRHNDECGTAGVAIKAAFRDAFGSDRVFPPFDRKTQLHRIPRWTNMTMAWSHRLHDRPAACGCYRDLCWARRVKPASHSPAGAYLSRLYETGVERNPKATRRPKSAGRVFKIPDEPCLIQIFISVRITWQIPSRSPDRNRRRPS